jgi:plastocyanin
MAGACSSGPSTPSGPKPNPGDPNVITVTSTGVSPKTLTVKQGTQVTFLNNDSRDHEMTSDPHPTHENCPTLNQVGFLKPGQFRQSGNLVIIETCGFHDHLNNANQALRGTITITP